MTDNSNKNSAKHALDTLEWDIQPERDLWPDIHSNIRFSGKPKPEVGSQQEFDEHIGSARRKTIAWVPMSVAACMLLAFGAFIMSSLSFQRAQQTYELQASFIDYQKSQIGLIEQQHAHVRKQFVALLDGELGPIDPMTVAEVQAVLLTIDQASMELKRAILAEPLNKNYATMLARTYQEELKLLNKFKAKDGTPLTEVSL